MGRYSFAKAVAAEISNPADIVTVSTVKKFIELSGVLSGMQHRGCLLIRNIDTIESSLVKQPPKSMITILWQYHRVDVAENNGCRLKEWLPNGEAICFCAPHSTDSPPKSPPAAGRNASPPKLDSFATDCLKQAL
jgi:hypothetical protein